jgi:hypothetical protein
MKEMMMDADTSTGITDHPTTSVQGYLVDVGEVTFPIYGDQAIGWSIVRQDIVELTPYRYDTLDELLFALLNFTIASARDAHRSAG